MPKVCGFSGCDKTRSMTRGYCGGHYQQLIAGRPLTALRMRHERNATCTVENCPREYRAKGLCQMHLNRLKRHGSVGPAEPLRNRYDHVTYPVAHARIRRVRGKASAKLCSCGAKAAEWAYMGGAPDEQFGPKKPQAPDEIGWGFYSEIPDYYEALCNKCHSGRDGRIARDQLQEYRQLRHDSGLSCDEIRKAIGLKTGYTDIIEVWR